MADPELQIKGGGGGGLGDSPLKLPDLVINL